MNPPRAMVLAAGFGTRLRPLTRLLPKPLVPVANRPLITYTLSLLRRAGVRRAAVNLHHLGQRIEETLGDGSAHGLNIVYSPEDPILGTGGGVVRMRSFLEGGRFFLLNADVICDVDLRALLRFHRAKGAAATMVVGPLPAGRGYTPLAVDADDWLVDFKDSHREPQGARREVMFLGIHLLEPVVFDFLPGAGYSCINNQAYPAMIARGLPVAAFRHQGFWLDLGTPGDYLAANRAILSGKVHSPRLDFPEDCSPEGVLLGRGVKMGPGTRLGPEAAIGDDCTVGASARIARSVIWAGEEVAAGANFDGAILAGGRPVRPGLPSE